MLSLLAYLPSLGLQVLKGLLLLMIIFVPLELAFAQRSQSVFRPQWGEDMIYFWVNNLVPKLLLSLLVGGLFIIFRPIYASGIFHWVGTLPLGFRFVLAIVVGDIGSYWGHRWSHEWPFLWHFHRIHHQAEAMDWLVTSRAHPVDMVFTRLCGLTLIYLSGLAQGSLGQGTAVMTIYVLIGGVWAYFVHANIGWRFGFLERWLATPAFHHWHHSNESIASIDKNYAAIFPWIDRFFLTYYLPRQRWPERYGLKELPVEEPADQAAEA